MDRDAGVGKEVTLDVDACPAEECSRGSVRVCPGSGGDRWLYPGQCCRGSTSKQVFSTYRSKGQGLGIPAEPEGSLGPLLLSNRRSILTKGPERRLTPPTCGALNLAGKKPGPDLSREQTLSERFRRH